MLVPRTLYLDKREQIKGKLDALCERLHKVIGQSSSINVRYAYRLLHLSA